MVKNISWPAIVTVGVIVLLLGAMGGAFLFPNEKTVDVEKIVEVPGDIIEVEKIVEVAAPSMLDNALATFLEAVEDEEDEAGNELELLEGYDFEEVSINKVYDEYAIFYDDDETIVEFQVKLKYKEDGEKSEKETYNVRVTYEEYEDSIVEAAKI